MSDKRTYIYQSLFGGVIQAFNRSLGVKWFVLGDKVTVTMEQAVADIGHQSYGTNALLTEPLMLADMEIQNLLGST